VEAKPLAQDLALPIQKTTNSPPSELDGQIDLMATPAKGKGIWPSDQSISVTLGLPKSTRFLKAGWVFTENSKLA
jgi:hypothetical protein